MVSETAPPLPTGTVTMMFTDIEGSTRLLAALGARYGEALSDQRKIVRSVITEHGGSEVDTQGDAFFVVFPTADAGVAAAVGIQRSLAAHAWPDGTTLRVRIGVHTGQPVRYDEGYVGIELHVGARISGSAHGGQVVLSEATALAAVADLPDGVRRRPLGRHLLKDLEQPLELFDLVIDGLENDFPRLKSLGRRDTNLPADLPELIARGRERAEVAARLRDRDRLVTLTGPGGAGKTTLALHIGRDLLDDFPDGVFLVSLSSIDDPALASAVVADALELRERSDRARAEIVTDFLATRRCLLVVDNLEHVFEAAEFLDHLLHAAPGVRVLLTSRIPTRLPIESEFVVRPLSVRAGDDGRSAAVELFVERATAASPAFRLDDRNRDAVTAICEGLDGLPLAIELAAARIRLMSPARMADRLARPLELAAGGSRTRDSRQQTLRATIEWGFGLLTPEQQRLLERLGVFAGRFTLDAAEEVCGADLDDLAALLENNLVRAVEGDADEAQLQLLFTIRAYARERLDASGLADRVREQHADRCAGLGRAAGDRLLDGRHERLLPRFDREQDDLRAALEWLEGQGRHEAALSLCADLAIFWDTRGQWVESRERLERALLAAPGAPAERRAKALFSIGRACVQQGDTARADSSLSEALPYYRSVGDARAVTLCLSHLAWSAVLQADRYADAVALADEALRVARVSGDPWTIAVALNNLADEDVMGDPDRRYELLAESAALRRTLGERRPLSITLDNLGVVELERGRLEEAEVLLTEALALAADIGFAPGIVSTRQRISRLQLARGDLEAAEAGFAETMRVAERLGDVENVVRCLRGLAAVAGRRGLSAERDRLLADSDRLADDHGVVLY